MSLSLSPRAVASAALTMTLLAVLYVPGVALTGWEPALGWLIQAVMHLGELLAVAALVLCGAVGRGPVGRIGLVAALLGQAVLAVAEPMYPVAPAVADPLFAVGPLLTGAGLVVAGIAVLRARLWTGWQRCTPVAVGAYVVVVLTPVSIGTGGPPATAALWALAGWELLWVSLAAAALTRAPRGDSAAPSSAGRAPSTSSAGTRSDEASAASNV